MSSFTSRSFALLAVSLPSESTTSAFFRCCPVAVRRTACSDCVVHRRGAVGRDTAQGSAEQLPIGRPALHENRTIVEAIQKDFILCIEQIVEKSIERISGRPDSLPGHAAARVERDSKADRHALGAEVRDRLRPVVFVHREVLLSKARDESAGTVGHRGGDVDQLDTALEAELGVGSLRRGLLRVQRDEEQSGRQDDHDRSGPGRKMRSAYDPSRPVLLGPYYGILAPTSKLRSMCSAEG